MTGKIHPHSWMPRVVQANIRGWGNRWNEMPIRSWLKSLNHQKHHHKIWHVYSNCNILKHIEAPETWETCRRSDSKVRAFLQAFCVRHHRRMDRQLCDGGPWASQKHLKLSGESGPFFSGLLFSISWGLYHLGDPLDQPGFALDHGAPSSLRLQSAVHMSYMGYENIC